jgi:hypothetical protein
MYVLIPSNLYNNYAALSFIGRIALSRELFSILSFLRANEKQEQKAGE